ncbi:hypothetical protein B0H21DRAFT_762376 [Amylocystis lapponica]|nr:hypothetical protein B0H21DRAFT_762376 [Amylocystis lapponica]
MLAHRCSSRHLCPPILRPHHRPFSFTPNTGLPRLPARHDPHKVDPAPSFREEIGRTSDVESFSEAVRQPSIRNQVLFFVFGSAVAFGVAARQTNEETLQWTKKLRESGITWTLRTPTNEAMRRARQLEFAKKLQTGLNRFSTWVADWPETLRAMSVWTYAQVAQPLVQTTEGRRVCWTIGALNGLVWLAWQFPQLQPVMMRSFAHSPLSGLSYTMLTSMFSHSSFFHLLFNCMALASFGSSASQYLARTQPESLRESTSKYHFLAFFVSAGLFSGLASHVVAARITFPRLVAGLIPDAPRTILPSLGASGAIYATVTLTALAYPDAGMRLIFPPTPEFPIQYGVGALVALDCVGALRGWRMFDHVAHLGGAAFGALYYAYGPRMWEQARLRTLGGLPRSLSSS